jgi:hypothetical protein
MSGGLDDNDYPRKLAAESKQWGGQQIEMMRSVMSLMLRRLRKLRWGAIKTWEGRPTSTEVVAASPFESIR